MRSREADYLSSVEMCDQGFFKRLEKGGEYDGFGFW